ncbi:MAG: citrate/2-methylcitrate synthase [Armatimonadota bacterium]|nr:citrate/2-methylcitrate synthase [Armatimonadota bacterium]MDR7445488.1 citrate/2-methylcitrate synthase [Armatimonadota bacterium]MDR7460948.1 citrate/2-methylcitrate synthase [Armatimonadota bacterium]MDR7477800.1 citrate/2-methylcitrate synthase [Armatimonadota bacterium]MDR7514044.1 citrate/2-methylcitrate synthase [Armatimonadota bacterium]
MTQASYSPGLEGVIAAATGISYLDVEHEQIVLRGYDLIELARTRRYTEVAYLTLYGHLPSAEELVGFERQLKAEAELPEEVYRLLELLPPRMHVMDAQRTALSFLAGLEDPDELRDSSPEANLRKGVRVLARMPAITANAYRALRGLPRVRPDPSLGFAEGFLYMLTGGRPDAEAVRVFDLTLTCYIEHEMPNSTFAARVIASTLSDLYGALVGAAASLKGPLHGGANEAVAHMLLDILQHGGAEAAEAYILERLRRGERIMGFGHRVYMRRYDPRALLMREFLPALASRRPEGGELVRIHGVVERVMQREKGLYPNADYPAGLIYYLLGIPIELYTPIFLVARTAGLVAHVTEQHANNRLFRPRVLYEGPRGLRP